MGIAMILLMATTQTEGIARILADPVPLAGLVLGLGLLGTGVAYILYYVIVEHLGAVAASSSTYIPPVVALVIGALLVGEPLRLSDGLAVGLILLCVLTIRFTTPKTAR